MLVITMMIISQPVRSLYSLHDMERRTKLFHQASRSADYKTSERIVIVVAVMIMMMVMMRMMMMKKKDLKCCGGTGARTEASRVRVCNLIRSSSSYFFSTPNTPP